MRTTKQGDVYFYSHFNTCLVGRSETFLATKLWPGDYGSTRTPMALRDSLDRLQTEYIDLYMMHWPKCKDGVDRKACLQETWRYVKVYVAYREYWFIVQITFDRILELELESDRCRSIGVSNFLESDLEDLMETASVVPHVNQCEFHPLQVRTKNHKGVKNKSS